MLICNHFKNKAWTAGERMLHMIRETGFYGAAECAPDDICVWVDRYIRKRPEALPEMPEAAIKDDCGSDFDFDLCFRGYDREQVELYISALSGEYDKIRGPGAIDDFNRAYSNGRRPDGVRPVPHTGKGRIIKNALFYAALVLAILLAFFNYGNKNVGKHFGPFAYNTVLTDSMRSVYPKGSLITSWAVKPDEPLKAGLADGTDIVFTKQDGTVIVHRIVQIMDDYEGGGQRAFKTQGVDNPSPDTWITYEGNVIGRVTWHVPYAGEVLTLIAANIVWVVLFIVVLFAAVSLWRIVYKKS